MFSSLAQRLGIRFLDGLDLVVELSTLGEFGVDREGVFALEAEGGAGACGRRIIAAEGAAPRIRGAEAALGALGRARDDCPRGARLSPACRGAAARP